MTSFFLKHSLSYSLKCISSRSSSLSGRRAIHSTSVVHKKPPKKKYDATTNTKLSNSAKRRAPLDSSKRSTLLNKLIKFTKPRLGSSPSKDYPKVLPKAWLTMIRLAKDGEDMTRIVDLIPMLHEGGGVLPALFAEEFVRHCEYVGCQALALEVFGNYAKYNITLTLNAGRWLIHSVHFDHPLKDLLIAGSLFSVHKISLSEDLVSASMFTAACLRHDTPHSRAMANRLIPKIKTMVEEKRMTTAVSEMEIDRQLKWVDWSLYNINKFVRKSSGERWTPLPFLSSPVS